LAGQHLMTAVQETFAKAVNTAPSDRQNSLRDDMAALRNSWEQLGLDLASVTAQLKSALTRWEDHADAHARMASWLSEAEAEAALPTPYHIRPQLSEMKTQQQRFKHMLDEVNCRPFQFLLE